MPYPRTILTMAQNLITIAGENPDVHENKFYMLWNGILYHHFPLSLEYGVAPQTSITGTGTKPEFLVVKVAREEESIVLVVELKKPAEDTPAGRQKVVEELAEYIEERFDETEFSTIYAIGGIGLSFAVYKMNKPGPPEPQLVFDWSSNVTAATSFDRMVQVATSIDEMTSTTRI